MRTSVEVKQADADDLPLVAELCLAARREASSGTQIHIPDNDRIIRQLSLFHALPGGRVLVAGQDGAMQGFLLARLLESHLFADEPSMYIEALYVGEGARRRGVGHALLSSAAELAAEYGAVDVYSVPIPGTRGVQRFLARVGFAPVAGHRVVATAVLQRRLAAGGSSRNIEDIIARRRRTRSEIISGPLDLRDFQEGLGPGSAGLLGRISPAK